MINGNLDQFLDNGWFSETTLYYNGYIYWLEAQTDDIESVFFIDRWKAQNEDNKYYHSILNNDGTLSYDRVLEIHGSNLDLIKKQFLEATPFEGKTFWQVEKEIAWLDEGSPIK
jgi:hypothetical protein